MALTQQVAGASRSTSTELGALTWLTRALLEDQARVKRVNLKSRFALGRFRLASCAWLVARRSRVTACLIAGTVVMKIRDGCPGC